MKPLRFVAALPFCVLLCAQTWTPRVNFGARLEPRGVVVHGAGQDAADFAAYWNILPIGRQPQVYMFYMNLDKIAPGWVDNLKSRLQAYPGSFLIPQIGINFTNGVNAHYEADVAAGKYDAQIGYLVDGLRQLATPAYLRIGYEFNGLSWNGYQPADYILAYIRIAEALRAAPEIEVATVWDAEVDGAANFMDYYPGDDYVDWFGMNIFNGSSFSNPILTTFMSLADTHQKPVMIGETTPLGVGAQQGSASWDAWFAPFFNYLQATPEVKQFNYIDCDWSTTQWPTWGDSRLQLDTAADVRSRYTAQLGDPAVLSGASETAFRGLLGYDDMDAPAAVPDLQASETNGSVVLTWSAVSDPSGIARYYIYRNGTLLDFSLGSPYTDGTAPLGTSSYSIAAMDRAGNLSTVSDGQIVTLNQTQRVRNGGFESGFANWSFPSYNSGAAGTAVVDSSDPISGAASVKINVTKSSGTSWHLQLRQDFAITQGLSYTVSFAARSSDSVTMPVVIQQVGSPYDIDLGPTNFTATTTASTFTYKFTAAVSQPVEIGFWAGNVSTSATLWLDDISVTESSGANPPPNILATGVVSRASSLPPIAPGGWMTLKGANLAPVDADTWDASIVDGVLPTTLDGVSVTVGGTPAYVAYVSPSQIHAIVPNVAPGQSTLAVTTPDGTTTPVIVNIAAQAPAFFLWPGNQVAATRDDGSYVAKPGTFSDMTTSAALPGDVISLWGTGFGVTTPAVAPGILTPSDALYFCDSATATLGGIDIPVFGCVSWPGYAGLYQVRIQVPPSLDPGDYLLKVLVDNATSPGGVILSIGSAAETPSGLTNGDKASTAPSTPAPNPVVTRAPSNFPPLHLR
jgi:uncharacterized protein (TIGR03437 family)